MSSSDEKNALSLLLKGHESGLRSLFDLYYLRLYKYAYKLAGNKEIAEEITQDVFVYLWEKREVLRIDSVIGYMTRMIKNRCIDHHRKKVFLSDISEIDHNLFVERNSVEVEHNELDEIIKSAVDDLPEKCAVILRLSRFSGLSHQEIGDQLGISKKTIENQVTIGLKRIRKTLEEYGYSTVLVTIIGGSFVRFFSDLLNY